MVKFKIGLSTNVSIMWSLKGHIQMKICTTIAQRHTEHLTSFANTDTAGLAWSQSPDV